MPPPVDPVELTARLVRCASVTPKDDGALDVVQTVLEAGGFACTRIPRRGIDNLFARWGEKGHARSFGFNGHTDVVPTGDAADWRFDPFSAHISDGRLWGRGAADMKSGVAAFAAAAVEFVTNSPPDGAIILSITGDEEADGTDGTVAILDWMIKSGEAMTDCLVGEPTCPTTMGETMKVGRRGSMTAHFEATGVQGHSAYPHRAKNPVPAIARLADRLARFDLDQGTEHFDASTLAVTTIDTGNPANNVIPAACRMAVNIRFNDAHTAASLTAWLKAEAADRCVRNRCRDHHADPGFGRKLSDPAGGPERAGGAGGGRHDRAQPGTFDIRRHVGRSVHQKSLPGCRIWSCWVDHAQSR